jgi:hypothetical protein
MFFNNKPERAKTLDLEVSDGRLSFAIFKSKIKNFVPADRLVC